MFLVKKVMKHRKVFNYCGEKKKKNQWTQFVGHIFQLTHLPPCFSVCA